MKILRFPSRPRPPSEALGRLASIEALLAEYLARQARLREDGRSLQRSLERLSALAQDLARSSDGLRRSASRLRACRDRMRSGIPPA